MNHISKDAVIGDLNLITSKIDASELLVKVSEIFEAEQKISGIIITKSNSFLKMLSRKRFFEIMSKQFMFDLFLKRSIEEFFFENRKDDYLIFPSETPVLTVANEALLRNESTIHDPIIVQFGNGEIKLLDFFELLLAQTRVHLLISNLLKDANEFKKDVLGVLGHDLRNPINTILGFADELKTNSTIDEEGLLYVGYIEQATNQMKDLVGGLMKSAFNDAVDFELSYSEFNLIDLINSLTFSFRKNLEAKNQTLLFEFNGNQIIINADKHKIKEVLDNLISNAIKYSAMGKEIKVTASRTDDTVEIEIKDEGPGFSDTDLTKIFRKFQRLSAKPTNNESSTGLGLYIVKRIISQHQGQILLESEINIGSTFKILLPIKEVNRLSNTSIIINCENSKGILE